MASNPLTQIAQYGQSVWYDNISRDLVKSGELQRLIDEDGVVGQTSNPNFFKEAIVGRADYDEQMRELARQGKNTSEVYEALTTTDVGACCDVFLPLYQRTNGADGYVSIEVSPTFAHDTEATVTEARRLWKTINRPNLMIKVPAAPEGIPAIKTLISEGHNVNVTLVFSIPSYKEVMEAYIAGLEARAAQGLPIDRIASVGSFFVSRVDVMVDKMLDDKIKAASSDAEKQRLQALLGKAAIANAKEAYHVFRETFSGPRWEALAAKGGKVQRPLWASTGAKNPAYRDVLYAEELIGPDTVDTMGPPTIAAMRDHGIIRGNTVEEDYAGAQRVLAELAAVGIDMTKVTQDLQDAGIKQFADSFNAVVGDVGKKREQFAAQESQAAFLADGQGAADAALARFASEQWGPRIWSFDPTVWKSDAETGKKIVNRLGWLAVVPEMQAQLPGLLAFVDEVRAAGFTHAVLCGMGGSSLAPEVFRDTFGVQPGFLDLVVLDTTDPATVLLMDARSDPAKTLFVISTKSGGTTETLSYFQHFYARVQAAKGDRAGENFIAITDPGSGLETLAQQYKFRRTFLNRADIGGRYSALTYFGLVPAALVGADVGLLLARAQEMAQQCGPNVPPAQNPGFVLGAAMGTLGLAGRDKVTFIPSVQIATYGYWVEQLIAESTGKEGKGLVPVEGEPVGVPAAYGNDRFFAYLRLDADPSQDMAVEALKTAGHPVMTYHLRDVYDIGAQMVLWEFATGVAGGLMDINPFDEPNVQESKDNTARLLTQWEQTGTLPQPGVVVSTGALSIAGTVSGDTVTEALAGFLNELRPGDYFDIAGYVTRNTESATAFLQMRTAVRDAKRVATTVGFGPRFLHSTGQLHKGGPNTGVFLQVVLAVEPQDADIPGAPYTFATLIAAQALGDLQSLGAHGRRAVRVYLSGEPTAALHELTAAVAAAAVTPVPVVSGAER